MSTASIDVRVEKALQNPSQTGALASRVEILIDVGGGILPTEMAEGLWELNTKIKATVDAFDEQQRAAFKSGYDKEKALLNQANILGRYEERKDTVGLYFKS